MNLERHVDLHTTWLLSPVPNFSEWLQNFLGKEEVKRKCQPFHKVIIFFIPSMAVTLLLSLHQQLGNLEFDIWMRYGDGKEIFKWRFWWKLGFHDCFLYHLPLHCSSDFLAYGFYLINENVTD